MSKNILRLCIAILVSAISVQTQSQIDQPAAQLTTEERVAKNKRLGELLRHPTFITLRLVANPRDFSHGNSSDASTAYTVDDWISFQLFVTQSLSENISITNFLWPFHEYRPELYKDGDLLPFSKEAQKNIEIAERTPPSGSMIEVNLVPNREHQWARVTLDDWYERLGAGHYQLSVRKRFAWDGDWVESNPVIFDVVPRKVASPIPTGVSVEMVPDGYQDKPKQKSYRLSGEGYISVVVVNDSDLELFVSCHRHLLWKSPAALQRWSTVALSGRDDETDQFEGGGLPPC